MARSNGRNIKTRPKLPKVDAEMQRWCAVLEEEISTWPDVTTRPMFGMAAYYRGKQIFAALPRTRAAETPFSFLLKYGGVKRKLSDTATGPGADWTTFAMESESDIPAAMRQLERAYTKAKRAR